VAKFFTRFSKRSEPRLPKIEGPEEPEHPDLDVLSRPQLLAAMAVTALILLMIARIWLVFEPSLFPATLKWQDAVMGLGFGIVISVVSGVVYWLWPAYRRSADFYLSFVLAPLTPADSIWVGLLPGMSEELLFRGVMLPAIGLNATGLVVSSVCFGVLHMSSRQQWSYAVWASVVGLGLGGSALLSGNLLVPIVAHITTNFVSSWLWQQRYAQTTHPS
jgi:uncharacterized protein